MERSWQRVGVIRACGFGRASYPVQLAEPTTIPIPEPVMGMENSSALLFCTAMRAMSSAVNLHPAMGSGEMGMKFY